MKASVNDVAERAGVSVSTVSRAFTRPELVSERTRKKVLQVAEELNFSVSRSAAGQQTGVAGVLDKTGSAIAAVVVVIAALVSTALALKTVKGRRH